MNLINDIKADKFFVKSIRLIILFICCFWVIDFAVGYFLAKGLEKYYGINLNTSLAIVGHSHAMLGFDKPFIEKEVGKKIAKYTREGVNVADRKLMIEHLVKKNKNLKLIIYGVDPWTFTGEGLSQNSYALFYPFLEDSSIDDFIKMKAPSSEYWTRKILKSTRYNEGLISSSFRGYLGKWDNYKYGRVDMDRLKLEISSGNFRKIKKDPENIKILKETILLLKEKNIAIILVLLPSVDLFREEEPKQFNEVISIYQNLALEFDNVSFLNYFDPFSSNYSLFFDPIHLNPDGQRLISKEIIKHLKND